MRTLIKKLILEEPVDDVVKTPLTEDSLIHDEPIEEPEVESEQETFDKTGSDFGIASMLNADIIDEFEAIDSYNSHIITLKDLINQETDDAVIESYKKIIEILTDIANEENIHVGQLQKALSLVSPSALFIKDGDIEADEVLEEEQNKGESLSVLTIANNGIITVNRGDDFSVPLFINMGTELAPVRYTLKENDEIYLGIFFFWC